MVYILFYQIVDPQKSYVCRNTNSSMATSETTELGNLAYLILTLIGATILANGVYMFLGGETYLATAIGFTVGGGVFFASMLLYYRIFLTK